MLGGGDQVIEIGPKGGDYRATVGRLHFTETTSNNMRKRGKPNPDQRYFALVCTVVAVVDDGSVYPLASLTSDKIIVRASNPGQFETEVSTMWTRSADGEGIHFNGNVRFELFYSVPLCSCGICACVLWGVLVENLNPLFA